MSERPDTHPIVPARFVDRPNRFLVTAELPNGSQVAAYLPNTGRLEHLVTPGRRLILRRDGVPPRTTEYTVTRAWDGCWVALEASRAPRLLIAWLQAGNPFPEFGRVVDVRSEVAIEGHRLDLLLTTDRGPVLVEVKSGGRATNHTALLSRTPSARGMAHLSTLARLAERGQATAAAFVVQRGDARSMLIGGDADPAWVGAVHSAHKAGVAIVAFGCQVTVSEVRVARRLSLVWDDRPIAGRAGE